MSVQLKRWMHWRQGFPGGPGLLIVYERKSKKRVLEAPYIVTEMTKDQGRAWCLTKVGMHGDQEITAYHVEIGPGDERSCQCRAWMYRQKCRHVEAITKLVTAGKL